MISQSLRPAVNAKNKDRVEKCTLSFLDIYNITLGTERLLVCVCAYSTAEIIKIYHIMLCLGTRGGMVYYGNTDTLHFDL